MKFVVHIGDGKTGTSAIQKTLNTQRARLESHGVLYLGLMFEFVPGKHDWQRPSRIEAFHSLPAERAVAELTDMLQLSIALAHERGLHTVVLSNETLLGRSAVAIAALSKLAESGAVVMPVAYVRRHDAWARSAYLQWGLRHKTYDGQIRDFRAWSSPRNFNIYRKLEPWLNAFRESVVVRNFDAITDAAADFLQVLGIDDPDITPARANETPAAEELALRALFNHGVEGRVAPARFNQLFDAQSVDFRLSIGKWLKSKLPSKAELERIVEQCADDRARIDAILLTGSQPPLSTDPMSDKPVVLDNDVMLGTLFQMIAGQAKRIEQLEQQLDALSAHYDAGSQAGMTQLLSWDVPVDRQVADAIAPSLGYFGAGKLDHLEIPVKGAIRELTLSVSDDKTTFLNLRKLELFKNGKALQPSSGQISLEQSSVSDGGEANGPSSLIAGTGIHSAGERSPWWKARFDPPLEVDELRVWNRSDCWGCRSRSLEVRMMDAAGASRCLYSGLGRANLQHVLAAASAASGISPPMPDTAAAAASIRQQLIALIAARLRSDQLKLVDIDWRNIVPMLDVWHSADPTPDEWTLMAAFLLAQQQARSGTSIKAFSLLLDSQARLERLQHELNQLGGSLGFGGFMLTRHGVKPEGVLRRHPERFLQHMVSVLAALENMGREPVLAYGTLLGAVRDGHFISHDDDIDLLYRARAASRAEVEKEVMEVKQALKAEGFRVVDLLPNSLNMHVIDAKNGAVMDVFPTWEEGNLLQMHMEAMKVRGIPPTIVYPRGRIAFLGEDLPVPAQPDVYLEERYGPGWRVSDQFFEWPWKLKSAETR
jgi:hypothetical protein